jgi:hypothetical protein
MSPAPGRQLPLYRKLGGKAKWSRRLFLVPSPLEGEG